ncbi:unnamed protein product [Durusdinium trenchii]|uniref:C-type lectin domain-containing protein n=1 Tax=Durusdinium trenchii TaxID=1381693 RepID=A0ABP0H635_9DINO
MPSPRRRASLPRAVMAVSWATLTLSTSAEDSTGCTITAKICSNFPDFQRTQFRDDIGETHVNAGGNDAACLKRAEDFHHWCGNGASDAQVAASYEREQLSQVYHPGACPGGWSQWDAFCYKHFWEKKTWFEAEAFCRQYGEGSHLASIHSRAENRFIFALTGGLSAWIGYTDLDQDTHYKWSDNTQDDFSNFAKNCTGREHEPDCKPEERQQQWYDWEGHDRGTFVCKRPPGKERTSAEKLDWALKGDESSSWKTAICRKRPKKLATILSISISTQTAPFYESKECIVAGCLAAQCVRQDLDYKTLARAVAHLGIEPGIEHHQKPSVAQGGCHRQA